MLICLEFNNNTRGKRQVLLRNCSETESLALKPPRSSSAEHFTILF